LKKWERHTFHLFGSKLSTEHFVFTFKFPIACWKASDVWSHLEKVNRLFFQKWIFITYCPEYFSSSWSTSSGNGLSGICFLCIGS
jgi:hypothetical protein